MSATANGDVAGRSETDRVSALELQSNRRMLYFSDGVMEELSSSDSETEPDVPDKAYDVQLQREMTLGPRLRYKASKVGNNILAGIDYVGGGLASFLGITDSKYASELKYHKRAKEQAEAEDAADTDLDNWQVHSNNNRNNNDTVVVCAPARHTENSNPTEYCMSSTPSRQ
ncbi:CG8300 [Drosophila busckii]|uniref:CG8300 n=1 Tax=Drosophila busckii TaxID=30019 RepID=A0A0M3QYW1_DROBS|nr:uncharacterized protein LOC108605996 [Drosophila busckii]ALC48373.1 CG8300 [Drosophila busckii]